VIPSMGHVATPVQRSKFKVQKWRAEKTWNLEPEGLARLQNSHASGWEISSTQRIAGTEGVSHGQ
jgi:hypothetical protein